MLTGHRIVGVKQALFEALLGKEGFTKGEQGTNAPLFRAFAQVGLLRLGSASPLFQRQKPVLCVFSG